MRPALIRTFAILAVAATGIALALLPGAPATAVVTWLPIEGSPASISAYVDGTPTTYNVTATTGARGHITSGNPTESGWTNHVPSVPTGTFDPEAWVRWTFDRPVYELRLGVGQEGTLDVGGSDTQGWVTSAGTDPFAVGNVSQITDAHMTWVNGKTDCIASSYCSGTAVINFPTGITWIETRGMGDGANPAWLALPNDVPTPKPAQTVTFADASLTTLQQPYAPAAATTDGDGAISYSVADAGTTGCTVDSTTGTISFTTAGTCAVTATAAATSAYQTGSHTATFTISKVAQAVTFGGASLSTLQQPYSPAAATTAGDGAISYSVADAGTTGCTVNASTGAISFATAGTCAVTATAAATNIYLAGSSTADFTISRVTQTVSLADANLTMLQVPYSPLPATTDGDGTITYSVDDAGTTGCTVDPNTGTITYVAAGTCTITATAAQTNTYLPASHTASYSISRVAQTVTFGDGSLTTLQDPYTPAPASTDGGGAITYSVADAGTTGCTVDPDTGAISFTAAGTCTVTASAAETNVYLPASHTASFTISPVAQTVTFAGGSITTLQTPYTPAPASTDGDGAITYSVADAGTTGCTLDPDTGAISFTGAGTCTVTASAAATGTHLAGSHTASFTISKVAQTVSFADGSITALQTPYTPAPATTDGDGAISYSVEDAGTTGCAVDAGTGAISFTAAGTCTVTATAAATGTYLTASHTASFTISKVAQTVTFPDAGLSTLQTPYTPAPATTDGDGAISYSVEDAGTTGCTVDAGTGAISFTASGVCSVTASAAATGTRLAASHTATFTISRVAQTVSYPDGGFTMPDGPYTPTAATTDGDGMIAYSVDDPGTTGCTVDPVTGTITSTATGTCTITATAAESSTYLPAAHTASFIITRATQVVTFTGPTSVSTDDLPDVVATASTTGDGQVTYSVLDVGTSDCTVDPVTGVVTASSAGTCVIVATVAQTGSYEAASATETFTITVPDVAPIVAPQTPAAVAPEASQLAATGLTLDALPYLALALLLIGIGLAARMILLRARRSR